MKHALIIIIFFSIKIFSQEYRVIRVIDGDTFEIEGGERVRMIGINAPEIKEQYGLLSKNYLKKLIENKYVLLEKGKITNDRGFYKRLLRYVYLDGVDINLKMIRDGYARAYLKYDFYLKENYSNAEKLSVKDELGIWKNSSNKMNNNDKFDFMNTKNKVFIVFVVVIILFGFTNYYK
jgi:micrococcal nuclease